MDERLKRSLGVLKDDAGESRKRCFQYRVDKATEEAVVKGWYVIMDTLTIEDGRWSNPEELLSGRGWAEYKKRWRRTIASATYGSRRKAPRDAEYIQYFGALEFGEDGDNPHVHQLWFCRDIPDSWKTDPNIGSSLPTRREITAAKSLWRYGFCTPVAVRTGFYDCLSLIHISEPTRPY